MARGVWVGVVVVAGSILGGCGAAGVGGQGKTGASSQQPVATEAIVANLLSQLQTIRSQIELYNIQNGANGYGPQTDVQTFWTPLVDGRYLLAQPKNQLQNSTKVGQRPGPGIGWVWAEKTPGDPSTLGFYAVDEKGQWFDESAPYRRAFKPRRTARRSPFKYRKMAMESSCKGTLGGLRATVANF